MAAGEFSWSGSANKEGNGSLAARVHYAQRYRTAVAHLDRTREEQGILKIEVIRTINWLEEGISAIERRLAALSELQAAGGSLAQRCSAAGQAALLQRELRVLQQIAVDANKLR